MRALKANAQTIWKEQNSSFFDDLLDLHAVGILHKRLHVEKNEPAANRADNHDAHQNHDQARQERQQILAVGQILIAKTWNDYAHIEDISVAEAYRGQGIGTMLLGKAETWAKTNNLNALSLECQDNNVLASRFYKKNGFVIGGVNTELYAMLGEPYASETAVFWYNKLG